MGFQGTRFRLVNYPHIWKLYQKRVLSVRGANDENVKRITQYLHEKPFCMNKKSEKPQVTQGIHYL